MRGHHAHRIERRGRVALDLHFAAIEPVEEALQRRRTERFEIERRAQHLLDRIARLLPQPLYELTPSAKRARKDFLQKLVRRRNVGACEQPKQRRKIGRATGSRKVPPKAERAARRLCHQPLLAPPDQRRHQQRRQREIIVRLQHEADRGEQILHRQRRVEPQPVNPRDRHTLGIQPRDDQRSEFAAPFDQDHDILGPERTPLALEHQRADPPLDRARDLAREFAGRIRNPVFLILFRPARHDERPERDGPRAGHFAGMDFTIGNRAEPRLGQRLDRGIDELEHGPGRAERLRQREAVPRPCPHRAGAALFRIRRPRVLREPLEMPLGATKIDRIGALKAENRLFEVADREERAELAAMRAFACKEFLGDRLDDLPLVEVGILRFVDQDMLGRLIELVTHPIAHPRLAKQRDCRADQIVEIDRANPPLRALIGCRIVAPDRQARRKQIGISGALAQRQQFGARLPHFDRQIGIVGVGGEQFRGVFSRFALRGERYADQIAEHPRAHLGCRFDPAFGDVSMIATGRRSPGAVRRRQPRDCIDVERGIATGIGDLGVDFARRQIERTADEGVDTLPHRQFGHCDRCTGAGEQEALGLAFAQPEAQRPDRRDRRVAALGLGGDEQFGERLACEQRFLARFDRAEAGCEPRLNREGR